MNHVLMLTYNSISLTKDAVASVLAQDVPCRLLVLDDGSDDGTLEYLRACGPRVQVVPFQRQYTSRLWNIGLRYLFSRDWNMQSVLVINNDVRLRPDTLRHLIADGSQFVTCVGTSSGAAWPGGEPTGSHRPHPDFSCFLIRRDCWEKVGEFDPSMQFVCSDGDYHLRMHKAGVEAVCLDLAFWHYASGTLKQATDDDRERILKVADADRAAFLAKWGFQMGTREYYAQFAETAAVEESVIAKAIEKEEDGPIGREYKAGAGQAGHGDIISLCE